MTIDVLDYIDTLPEGAKIAANWDVVDRFTEDKWNDMIHDAVPYQGQDSAEYIAWRQANDVHILQAKLNAGEKVVKRNGDWMWSKVCNKSTYRTNMSIISRCIDKNIPLLRSDGTARGRTELEKELRGIDDSMSRSAYDKCVHAIQTLDKNINELTDEELLDILAALNGRYG